MKNLNISRRRFLGTAAGAATLTVFPLTSFSCLGERKTKKPNSNINGVQLGCTTYSYRTMPLPRKVDEVIEWLLLAGINTIEARHLLEESLGIPGGRPIIGSTYSEMFSTPEELDEWYEKNSALIKEQHKWRHSLPMQKYEDIHKKFDDAGIDIHVVKFEPTLGTDEDIDYAFNVAKILGAYGVSDEMGKLEAQRLGKFAEKHNMLSVLHTHGQFGHPDFDIDQLLSYSPANKLEFDIGHYYGSTGLHPNNIIEKYHDRIFSLHIKDKTGPKSDPPNTNKPFGQGETPIADVLLLLKKEKWPIYVDIELEYPVEKYSNAAKEVVKCMEYMRNILE